MRLGRGTYGIPLEQRYGGDAEVYIGSYCSIAEDVTVMPGGEHHTEWVANFPSVIRLSLPGGSAEQGTAKTKGDIVIGSDVWIGRHVIILSGVHVGHGAVIGAGSVVSSNIPAYAIWAGNPARHIRWRFPEYQRRRLEEIAWWDWPEERIRRYGFALNGSDILGFIEAVDAEDGSSPVVPQGVITNA